MDFNVAAALVAGVAGFFVGGLWYSKRAFGTAWGKANGYFDASGNLKPEIAAKVGKHPGRAFAIGSPPGEKADKARDWTDQGDLPGRSSLVNVARAAKPSMRQAGP